MNSPTSIVLHRLIKSIIITGALVASASAFATCGEVGRPPCELEPVYSRAEFVDVNVSPMTDPYADWIQVGEGNPDGGGGAQTAPLPDFEPSIVRDLEGCGVFTVDVAWQYGGGTVSFRLCPVGNQLIVRDCNDSPLYGDPVQQCL